MTLWYCIKVIFMHKTNIQAEFHLHFIPLFRRKRKIFDLESVKIHLMFCRNLKKSYVEIFPELLVTVNNSEVA